MTRKAARSGWMYLGFFVLVTAFAQAFASAAGMNLLKNGSLDAWTGDKPDGWESPALAVRETKIVHRPSGAAAISAGREPASIKFQQGPVAARGDVSILQSVEVKPNTNYTWKSWYKTVNLFAPSPDQGYYVALWAGNYEKDLARFTSAHGTADWTEIALTFNTGNYTRIMCQVRGWNFSGTVYTDDCELVERKVLKAEKLTNKVTHLIYADGTEEWAIPMRGEARRFMRLLPDSAPMHPEPNPRHEDSDRGYLTFVRPGRMGVGPSYRPATSELTSRTSIFASLGELEPATFGIRALRDLGKVAFSISEFRDPEGRSLGGETPDLYGAEYTAEQVRGGDYFRWQPKWLIPLATRQIRRGENLQVWLDVNVPGDTRPGKYTCDIRIAPQSGKQSKFVVELTVLPLQLHRSLGWGFFFYGWNRPEDDRYYEAVLKEMRRAGMTCCVISPAVQRVIMQNGNIIPDMTIYKRALDLYQKVGFSDPPVLAAGGSWVSGTISLMGRSKDFPNTWDNYGTPQFDIGSPDHVPADIKDKLRFVIRHFYDYSLEKNWPRFYSYMIDEPSSGSPKMAHAQVLYRLCREVAPEMPTASTVYTFQWWKDLSGLLDMNIVHYVHPAGGPEGNRRWMDFAAEQKCILYGIDFLGASVDTFWDGRYISLIAERAGLAGMICWTQPIEAKLAGTLDPYFGLDVAKVFNQPWYMIREEDGRRVPGAGWMGLREGIDDSRYYRTARDLAEEAARNHDPAVRASGEAALKRVRAVLETWPWCRDVRWWDSPEMTLDGTHGVLEPWVWPRPRYTSADADRSRWQLAQIALEMQKLLKYAGR